MVSQIAGKELDMKQQIAYTPPSALRVSSGDSRYLASK